MTPVWSFVGLAGFFVLTSGSARTGVRIFWGVAVGAALGGLSRFYLGSMIQQWAGADFPLGTLIINISGSLLLGFIMRYALQSNAITPVTRTMLATGFCGGYTTFSTFAYDTALQLQNREYGRAAVYVGTSVVVAVIGMFAGFAIANQLLALRHGG
jgi:CrcB protein